PAEGKAQPIYSLGPALTVAIVETHVLELDMGMVLRRDTCRASAVHCRRDHHQLDLRCRPPCVRLLGADSCCSRLFRLQASEIRKPQRKGQAGDRAASG